MNALITDEQRVLLLANGRESLQNPDFDPAELANKTPLALSQVRVAYSARVLLDDITLDLPISLDEAVNGAKVKVPTVDGAVMLTVAPGSGSGKVLRLKGKGFTRADGTRGDQLVTLEIDLPPGDEDLAKRLEGWRDTRNLRARLGV